FVTALAVGLIVSHRMVIPTPGPLVVAEHVGVDLGLFLILGIFTATVATLVRGYGSGTLIGTRVVAVYVEAGLEGLEVELGRDTGTKKQITKKLSFGLLLLPIVLILSNTVADLLIPDNPLSSFFAFVGDKNVALLISVLVALIVLRPYIAGD